MKNTSHTLCALLQNGGIEGKTQTSISIIGVIDDDSGRERGKQGRNLDLLFHLGGEGQEGGQVQIAKIMGGVVGSL